MTLIEQIRNDLTASMKARDAARTSTLRMLMSELKREEIDKGTQLTDEVVMQVVKKAVKSREDSVAAYRNGNRADLAEKEEAEIAILSAYLPEPLSTDELDAAIRELITATGATSPRDMGRIMKGLKERFGERVDGKAASNRVRELLS